MKIKNAKIKHVGLVGDALEVTLELTVTGTIASDGEYPVTAVLTVPMAALGLLLKLVKLPF